MHGHAWVSAGVDEGTQPWTKGTGDGQHGCRHGKDVHMHTVCVQVRDIEYERMQG